MTRRIGKRKRKKMWDHRSHNNGKEAKIKKLIINRGPSFFFINSKKLTEHRRTTGQCFRTQFLLGHFESRFQEVVAREKSVLIWKCYFRCREIIYLKNASCDKRLSFSSPNDVHVNERKKNIKNDENFFRRVLLKETRKKCGRGKWKCV